MDNKTILNDTAKWWEKKRLLYNIIVGLVGVLTIISIKPIYFGFYEFIGIIIWAIGANIFFSLGILVEIFDLYYLEGKLNIYKFRLIFLILGLFIASYVTFINVVSYYFQDF